MFEKNTVDDLQNYWRDPYLQWWAAGMPSYNSKNTEPWKQITVRFRTMEDRLTFAKRLDLDLTEKTNSVWLPVKKQEKNALSRYIGD
jgi:hypothetical protein